jgi:isocitrate dehydrogenase
MKWEGGYVWACKNYDGDVQSDTVAQGFGSLGLMTSVLMTPDGKTVEAEAAHGTGDPALPPAPAGQADLDQPDRLDLRLDRRPQAPRQAGRHPEVTAFAEALERVCVETVEAGTMTKDLALLVGPDQAWLTTRTSWRALDQNLSTKVAG